MSEISATQWQELSPILDELLEAGDAVRSQRLAQIRRANEALANHLEALLRQRTAVERDAFLEGDTGFTLAHEPSLAGQTLGAYTLREPIGQGGMGSVWRAERSDGRYQASVAVKFLNLALLGHGIWCSNTSTACRSMCGATSAHWVSKRGCDCFSKCWPPSRTRTAT